MSKDIKKNIFQRINAVMNDVDYIQKEQKKVANQYRFVSHDAVSAALHAPMTKHGIACISTIAELKQDGNRTEVKLDVSFINIDDPQDHLKVTYYGYGIDTGDKGIGKAVSYAFKYALLKTFCLETGDDPDQDQNVKHEPSKGGQRQLSQEEIATFLESYGEDKDALCQYAEYVSQVKEWSMNKTMLTFIEKPERTRNAFALWLAKEKAKHLELEPKTA